MGKVKAKWLFKEWNDKHFFWCAYLNAGFLFLCSALDFKIGIVLLKFLTIFFFIIYMFVGNKIYRWDFEKTVIVFFFLFFSFLLLIHGKARELLGIVALTVLGVYLVKHIKLILYLKKWVVIHRGILAVMLLFLLLSLEVIDSYFMWDARVYYDQMREISEIFNYESSGIYDLFLAGHVSLGYSLWQLFFQLIKEGAISAHLADMCLAVVSVYAYYHILRKVFGNKYNNDILALASVPYAFSPFVLGMTGNINLDNATMYFAVIFIACSMYQYECLELLFAFCFCFTKEPAILYYVAYVFTKIICVFCQDHPFQLKNLVKFGFSNFKNYLYAFPVIILGLLCLLNTQDSWASSNTVLWNNKGFNCFGVNKAVVIMRFRQIFLLNFNWIIWIVIILGILFVYIKRKKIDKKIIEKLLPIFVLGIIVIAFGILYITYTHVRYLIPAVPAFYLAVTMITANWKRTSFYLWNILISVFLFLQCFYTIDPLTANLFPGISIGSRTVSCHHVFDGEAFSDHKFFNDSMIYNRQYVYWQEALRRVLEDAQYKEDMIIVLPDGLGCSKYELFGELSGESCIWNFKNKQFGYLGEDKKILKDDAILNISNVEAVRQGIDGREIKENYLLYIVPGWAEINMDFISDHKIVKEGEVEYKGYRTQYMVMKAQYNLPFENGNYRIIPKLNLSMGLYTDGGKIFLMKGKKSVLLSAIRGKYEIIFEKYQMAIDIPSNIVDINGTIGLWKSNHSDAQKWVLEEVNGYYMICNREYALTYNLMDASIKLSKKTGDENQLWKISTY